MASSSSPLGRRSPANVTFGRKTTSVIAILPSAPLASVPAASSSYASTTKPPPAASARNHSMWQLDSAATSASSGSTAAGSDSGGRTALGELDAGTSSPPSNRQR